MQKADNLKRLTQKVCTGFESFRKRNLLKSFKKLKINMISNTLNATKIADRSQHVSNLANIKSYTSILPQEVLDPTMNQQHNFQQEKLNTNEVICHMDDRIKKQSYFQKHLNQTIKYDLRVQHFPASELTNKTIDNYHASAIKTITACSHITFFQQILVKRKSWGSWKTPSHRLKHKITMKSPLTYIKEEQHEKAIEVFKLLTHMEIMQIDRPRHHYAALIVNKVIDMDEEFRQEIFLQIIKQMNGDRHNQYLPLLVLFSTVVKISLRMYVPLLNYFYSNYGLSPIAYNYMFYAVIRNFEQSRKGPISDYQAMLVTKLRQIPVTVAFSTQKTFYVQTNITVQDIIQKIAQFYQLDTNLKYLLFHNGRYFQTGKLLDAFGEASFQPGNPYSQFCKFKGFNVLLIFKNMVDATLSKTNNDLLYSYSAQLYLNSVFTLTREQIISIAALKYYAQNDSLNQTDITLYIPKSYYQSHIEAHLERSMISKITGISCTKSQARNKILQILKKKDPFMSFIFKTQLFFDGDDGESIDIDLYLKPGRLIFIGRGIYSCYRKVYMNQISKWGKSKKKICIVVQRFGIVYIQSKDNDLICDIFANYLNALGKYTDLEQQ